MLLAVVHVTCFIPLLLWYAVVRSVKVEMVFIMMVFSTLRLYLYIDRILWNQRRILLYIMSWILFFTWTGEFVDHMLQQSWPAHQ